LEGWNNRSLGKTGFLKEEGVSEVAGDFQSIAMLYMTFAAPKNGHLLLKSELSEYHSQMRHSELKSSSTRHSRDDQRADIDNVQVEKRDPSHQKN
jgi:hypothetical protein